MSRLDKIRARDGDPDSDAMHTRCFNDRRYLLALTDKLLAALTRCETVLANMALENEGAIFNRWPISHEPLRGDARNVLPIARAAIEEWRK